MSDNPLADIRVALADIAERMSGLGSELREEITRTRGDLSDLRSELRDEMVRTRSEIMVRIDRLQDAATIQHEARI